MIYFCRTCRHVSSFLKEGAKLIQKILTSKKQKSKKTTSQNHENPHRVGGGRSVPLTLISLPISSLFHFTYSRKRQGGGGRVNSILFTFLYVNFRKMFAARRSGGTGSPHPTRRCYVPDMQDIFQHIMPYKIIIIMSTCNKMKST